MSHNARMQKRKLQKALQAIAHVITSAGGPKARICDDVTITQSTVSRLKNQKIHDPQLSSLLELADYFDITLDELTGRTQGVSEPKKQYNCHIHLDDDAIEVASRYSKLTPENKHLIYEFLLAFDKMSNGKKKKSRPAA